MSQRSRLSALSALSGLSTHTKSAADELYQYSLRVAYLSYLVSARAQHTEEASANGISANASTPASTKASHPRPHLRHQAEAWTNTIFSIADVFKDAAGAKDGKSVKFPKELVKVLRIKIEAIAKGADKSHQDLLLRSTFGVFYGTYTQDYYLKQLKENRNIEALILLFVTTATGVLKKRLQGDEWKMHLNSQVGVFVTIIRDCLRSKEVKSVPHELSARLDSYASKLAPPSPPHDPTTDTRKLPLLQSPSASTLASSSGECSSPSPWTTSHSIHDMPSVKTVGLVFRVPDSQLQKDLNNVRKFCTEKASLDDFKICMYNISQQCRFPGRRSDFDSDEAYQEWRTKELELLQQAMLQMIKTNPELVRPHSTPSDDFVLIGAKDSPAAPAVTRGHGSGLGSGSGSYFGGASQRSSLQRPNSTSSAGNIFGSESSLHDALKQIWDWDNDPDGGNPHEDLNTQSHPDDPDDVDSSSSTGVLTYIPPHPITSYIALMDHCLDFDLESMKNLAEDEEVSLKILSPSHLDLLEQCAFRWRLMTPLQVAVFFSAICRRFEEEEIPIIECVSEALSDVFKMMDDLKFSLWATRDKLMMKKTMSSLFDTLLRRVYEAIQSVLESKAPQDLQNALDCLAIVYESEPFQMITDLDQRFKEFTEAVTELYDGLYTFKSNELFSQGRPNDVVPFLDLVAWLNSGSSRINKKFKQPILDRIDLVSIYLSRLCRNLAQDLESMKAILVPPQPVIASVNEVTGLPTTEVSLNYNDGDVLDLYKALLEIQKKHDMCNPSTPLMMPIEDWFMPYVLSWLDTADTKTSGWVQSAIRADKFVPEGNDCHSTSIIDLMDSCRSAVDFVLKLKWPNEYQNAKFMTRLSRTISKSIEQYSQTIEEAFIEEIFPRASTEADREANRSAIWVRARLAVQGDKKPEAFQFQEASCIKLNNIESARVLLDKMYNTIDADKVARIIHEYEPESSQMALSASSSYLFTVKVVTAEGLVNGDGSVGKMDPFLTLSDEKGNRIAKTRTLYETTCPNWNETFDISVKGSLWLAATIYKRNLMEKHDFVGRAFLHLNPKEFNDFLAHDLLLDLDTRGRVLLRVSMEGEKDDVQFHFGKAFRSLKRAETDMVRMIIDKISPVIRYYLSHNTIRKLVPSPGFMKAIDMSKMSTKIDIDISKVTSYGAGLWRSVANSTREPEIPLPKEELLAATLASGATPSLEASSLARNRGPKELTDADIESAIADLFEYFDQCMSILRNSLSRKAGQLVMSKLWKEILAIIDGLLLPPLSDQPSEMRPLSGKEVDVVLKWLKFLTNFFHADGEGVPIEDLHNQKYKEIWSIGFFYDQHTDHLMEECVRAMQQQLRRETTKAVGRNKSVYQQRNLGTIRKRKADKKQDQEPTSSEMIMRILRLRPGTADFLQQQISTMVSVNAQQQSRSSAGGGLSRRGQSHHTRGVSNHSAAPGSHRSGGRNSKMFNG